MTLNTEQEEDFVNYWEQLYRDDEEGLPPKTQMIDPPTANEIVNSLRKLKRKKACGPDQITAELLQGAGSVGEQMTVKLIQRIWQEGRVPAAMKLANVILVPKTIPPSHNPAEHRPISLLNMWYKVLDNIIKDRL